MPRHADGQNQIGILLLGIAGDKIQIAPNDVVVFVPLMIIVRRITDERQFFGRKNISLIGGGQIDRFLQIGDIGGVIIDRLAEANGCDLDALKRCV